MRQLAREGGAAIDDVADALRSSGGDDPDASPWGRRGAATNHLPCSEAIALVERTPSHVQTIVNIDGQWIEEGRPARITADALHAIRRVTRAVQSEGDASTADIDTCRHVLGEILFSDAVMDAIRQVVRTGRVVDLRLHAAGMLAWPWELATQAERVEGLCGGGLLNLSRLVGGPWPTSAPFPPNGTGYPRLDGVLAYTNLAEDLDLSWALERWRPIIAVAPDALWSQEGIAAEVTMLTGHGHLASGFTLGVCNLRVSDRGSRVHADHIVDAVVAQTPTIAMLGICDSATETATTPSLGRLVARAGVGTVLAFRGKVRVEALRQCASALLEQLRLGQPTAYATARARQAISEQLRRAQLVVFAGAARP